MFDGDHDRRRLVAALSVTVVLVLAGCSGGSAPTCDVPTTVSADDGGQVDGQERLQITSAYTGNLTVIVRRTDDDATTFAERYPDGGEGTMRFDQFREGVDYRVTVRTDCEDAWTRTVRDGAFFHVAINAQGEVTLVDSTAG